MSPVLQWRSYRQNFWPPEIGGLQKSMKFYSKSVQNHNFPIEFSNEGLLKCPKMKVSRYAGDLQDLLVLTPEHGMCDVGRI